MARVDLGVYGMSTLDATGLARSEGATRALSYLPLAGGAFLVFAAYYLGAKVGLALTFHPHPISVLWPPNAILLAALLLAPFRWWPALILAAFPAHLLAELQDGVPAAMVLCWFVSNVSEALIGAFCVRWVLQGPLTFDSLRKVGMFIAFSAMLAPFISSFFDAAFVRLIGWGDSGYWQLWRTRFFSNILATLTIVPVIVTWATLRSGPIRAAAPGRLAEGIVLLAGLLAAGVVVFDADPVQASVPALLYLPLPFLLWAALRFGPAGSSAAFMIVAFLVIWGAGHGRGPFITGAPLESALSVQMFLIFVGVSLLVLAAGVQESRDSERRLRSSEQRVAASEERYREVVEAQTELVTRYARDGTLTFVNPAYCRFFGKSREQLIGSSLLEQVPESARATVLGFIEKLAVDQGPIVCERRVIAADGSVRWQQWVDYAILASDGSVVEFQGIGRDITDLKAAAETLRASDERFQLVLRATNDVIYDWDIVADDLWWNQNGEAYFGKVSDNGPRDYAALADLLHPEDRKRVVSQLRALIDGGGQVCDAEYRLRRMDGTYAYINGRGFILRDDAGKPLRMIGSLRDVTDRKRVEEANQRLAHVSRLAVIGELTASIAHEINQPLGAILSNADAADILLGAKEVPLDELRLIIHDIRRDDLRAGEVIKHMRALLRRRELAVQPFDLNRAISDILHLVGADLARHHVAVETAFAQLPIVHGDQIHLQQVVLNLILNGIEAMEDTPVSRRRFGIGTERAATGGVEVTVWDSGPGIAPDCAEQLFESFFTTKPNGMGLGLSIARSIVEAHGGTIRAATRREGGASFSFVLPGQVAGRRTIQMRT
jgi:PAS domain S-box-containing protein